MLVVFIVRDTEREDEKEKRREILEAEQKMKSIHDP